MEKNYINSKLSKILNYDFNINFDTKKINKLDKSEINLNHNILQKADEIHQKLLKRLNLLKKIIYISDLNLPNNSAQSIQILKMCDAFSGIKNRAVILFVKFHNKNYSLNKIKKNLILKNYFSIVSLFSISKKNFFDELFIFIISFFCYFKKLRIEN